ncbi:hypothetical protein M0813_17037 [Anaeramoeba flamelloides]|uniref:Uncharacterized protein n=1 Tax=Anaeramoeba flamelloides TaxID=1746091 RepID=A0ABQ8YYI3_9EUKA|nr:hypothetical protein M0813_17037 [Anaeramoeba flamelloides]
MGDFLSKEENSTLISDVFDINEQEEYEVYSLVKNYNLNKNSLNEQNTNLSRSKPCTNCRKAIPKIKIEKTKGNKSNQNDTKNHNAPKIERNPDFVPLTKKKRKKKEKRSGKKPKKNSLKSKKKQKENIHNREVQQKVILISEKEPEENKEKKKNTEKTTELDQGNEKGKVKEKEKENDKEKKDNKEKENIHNKGVQQEVILISEKEPEENKEKKTNTEKTMELEKENEKEKVKVKVKEKEKFQHDLYEKESQKNKFEFNTSSDDFFDEIIKPKSGNQIIEKENTGLDIFMSNGVQDENIFNDKEFEDNSGVVEFDGEEQEHFTTSNKNNLSFGLDPDWDFVGQQNTLILDEEDLIEHEIEVSDDDTD